MPPQRPAPLRPSLAALVAAPLYLGPFLAGLAQAPLWLMPAFVLAWALWRMLGQPAGSATGGNPAARVLGRASTSLAHAGLVVAAFALGRGFAGLIGAALALPGWAALAVAMVPVLLARRMAAGAKLDAARVPADHGEPAGSGA